MQLLGPKANPDSPESDIAIFQEFLSDPSTSIPINSNFLIVFNSFPPGLREFTDEKISEYEPDKWEVFKTGSSLIKKISGSSYNYKFLFATGITLPNEGYNARRTGPAEEFGDFSGGLLSGVTSSSRYQKDLLRMSLLETTDSFIDSVIRPWVVATSHYGLFARSPGSEFDIKTNIDVFMFNSRTNKREIQRKVYTFYGCAPTSFDEQTITYGNNDTTILSTSWVYNNYSIKTIKAPTNT